MWWLKIYELATIITLISLCGICWYLGKDLEGYFSPLKYLLYSCIGLFVLISLFVMMKVAEQHYSDGLSGVTTVLFTNGVRVLPYLWGGILLIILLKGVKEYYDYIRSLRHNEMV